MQSTKRNEIVRASASIKFNEGSTLFLIDWLPASQSLLNLKSDCFVWRVPGEDLGEDVLLIR